MISDENMETWVKSLVDTYFTKVQEKTKDGRGLVEIINENLADNAELMMQVDMIMQQTNKENYWKSVTSIAELARKYGKDRGNDFYGRVYDTILEISQECFEDDKVYTLDDLEEFRQKMQGVYDIAQMPEHIKQTGKTPDKIFLLAATAHVREGGEKYTEQMMRLLEVLKDGNLNLGVATKDLEDFCVQMANAYEEIKMHGTAEQREKFTELFMHNYCYTDNLKATNIKFRKSQYKFERSNSYLQGVQDDILSEPEFYTKKVRDENGEEISNIEDILRKNPQIFLDKFKRNQGFLQMFATQAIGKEPSDGEVLFFDDIKSELLGKKYPTLEDVYSFDYSSFNEIVPILLKEEHKELNESTVSRLKKSSTFAYDVEQVLKNITTFSNVGEEEFATEQAVKLSEKLAKVYAPDISLADKYNIAMAMIAQKAEITADVGIDFSKSNPDVFCDTVNGLKQYVATDEWNKKQVIEKMRSFGEKNPEALRVLEFIETDGISDYSQMAQSPVLTPDIMQEMARNPEVQGYVPLAGEVIERAARIEKEQVEH